MTPYEEKEFKNYFIVADKDEIRKFSKDTVQAFMRNWRMPTLGEILTYIGDNDWSRDRIVPKQYGDKEDATKVELYRLAKHIHNLCSYEYHTAEMDESLVSTVVGVPFETPVECAKYIRRVKDSEFRNDAEIEQWLFYDCGYDNEFIRDVFSYLYESKNNSKFRLNILE